MCTSVSLKSRDDLHLLARTMDFSYDLSPEMTIIQRDYPLKFGLLDQPLTNHFAFLGLSKNIGDHIMADGLNEYGLAAAVLYFEGYAHYNDRKEGALNLMSHEIVNWILASYTSIEEVVEAFGRINITNDANPMLGIASPLHWVFTDATGRSIIVEPLKDGLKIHENKLGVMANSPDYDWHKTNIRNYIGVNPKQVEPVELFEETFKPFGQGSGTFGLPGDYSPPSRFIRTLFAKLTRVPNYGEEDLVNSAYHILSGVDIMKGSVVTQRNSLDYTQYTTCMMTNTRTYYFKMYNNSQIVRVNLNDFTLDGQDALSHPVPTQQVFGSIK
ncbi:choloylglycine hydrolase family protein [Erysipelothrix sp. HDW6B]|uniref:linear amide C-N hydrolase n=1 Tax=Erysipelothrix sp. HDW6B TaxID=2714929 RepID=UPI00140932A9|nr:choloylglycine hydrolase family protein [Erysipelothrix sp. HDW6B]QIK86995.1 choloylglycine hydrolase family protein [Erysipelothrix sp. HDW6B]